MNSAIICWHFNLCMLINCSQSTKVEQKKKKIDNMNHVILRKQTFCIYEKKDADKFPSNCEAEKRLCFRYIYLNPKLPASSRLLCLTAGSVWELFGNHNVAFFMTQLIHNLQSIKPGK